MATDQSDVNILIYRVDAICKYVNEMKLDMKEIKGRINELESKNKSHEQNEEKEAFTSCD